MSSREDILASFQQITEINDIALAIAHLESTNWDLEAAIHLSLDNDNSHNDAKEEVVVLSSSSPDEPGPSSNLSNGRKINFNVQHKNMTHKISISESRTINDLKQMILTKTSVPVCRQNLHGWPSLAWRGAQENSTRLQALNLPSEVNLEMNDMSMDGISDDVFGNLLPQQPTETYQLRIKYTNENRFLTLNFPATKTHLDIKNDLYAVLKVPVRFQLWTGWPENTTNASKLSEIFHTPIVNLELTRIGDNIGTSSSSVMPVEIDSDSDSPDENFEDALNADEDMFAEPSNQNRLKLLIEDHIDDEVLGCLQFINNYKERYGHGPNFFEGNLYNALNTACGSKSARDRKLLAVYLHHDNSVLTNVFCGQVLGHDNNIALLNEKYILYGWDLTCESNKNMFLSALTACVTDSASLQIRTLPVNQFPIIMIIRKQRSIAEVADIIHGNINHDELYIHLMMNAEAFEEQMKIEIREENERAAREALINEQQMAYEESLLADRLKEEERLRKEQHEASEREKMESERLRSEAKKEAERQEAANSLPQEPASDCKDPISKIRFRTPKGDFIERRFLAENELKVLLNYATANGYSPNEFKIITSYPRRDLTTLDANATLKSLNLFPQETLNLEER